jgi:competence protein ComEC
VLPQNESPQVLNGSIKQLSLSEKLSGQATCLAVAMMLGIVLGRGFSALWPWLLMACVSLAGTLWMLLRGRGRGVRVWGTLCLIALSASWWIVRAEHTGRHELSVYIGETSQIARVVGEVVEPPTSSAPARGAFARFNYESPGTRLLLRVHTIEVSGQPVPAFGDLLVRIDQTDHRPKVGQQIQATGWLSALAGPRNAGEFDYRQYLADRGVVGRLTLRNRDNWHLVSEPTPSLDRLQQSARSWCADRAVDSLRIGMTDQTQTLGLLETMLLGRKGGSSRDVRRAFRQVGLAHLLSISGAHLGILLGLVWLITRWFVPNPPRAAMIVLAVLALYLMAVPLRVPIVRSAIMAGFFSAAYATGRQVRPCQVLAFAAMVVLLWRPMDLFSPGFQLSFAAVGGLLLFVEPVSNWIWPKPMVMPGHLSTGWVIGRWCADYLSVSLVAFSVVFPLVAYHFQMVNPLSVLLSVMALPVLTAVLGLGYFKILIGLLLPSAGLILSGPLGWAADSMLGLVGRAGDWPGASIELTRQPSVAWVIGALSLVLGLLAGSFAGRRRALFVGVLVMGLWTWVAQAGRENGWLGQPSTQPTSAVLTMFAVGDGSCYLLELPGHTLMFDCGSQQYFDIAHASILPTLKRMGIKRIDTLILSHADMDHYGGSLDLAEGIPIGRVLVTPQLLGEAEQKPAGSTAFLIEGLRSLGLPPKPIARGWSELIGDVEVHALWPPADFAARRVNDTSVVLSIRVTGRRILLNGDIQDQAINQLIELENLNADITDLPHHGAVVDASPDWLKAVAPSVILQSSGRTRLYQDRWSPILKGMAVRRLVTTRDGMSQVRIERDGHTDTWSLLPNEDDRP